MTGTLELARSGALLARLRSEAPLVQCITNGVAMNVAANVLLAAGASPAMVAAPEEAGEFAGYAGAVTINIGTLSSESVAGMEAAAAGAVRAGTPWVLDPVAHQATAYRRATIARLMALKPTIIRGNASETSRSPGGRGRRGAWTPGTTWPQRPGRPQPSPARPGRWLRSPGRLMSSPMAGSRSGSPGARR